MEYFFPVFCNLLVTVASYIQTFANTMIVNKIKPMEMDLLLHLRNRSWTDRSSEPDGLKHKLCHPNFNECIHHGSSLKCKLRRCSIKKRLSLRTFIAWPEQSLTYSLSRFFEVHEPLKFFSFFFPKGNDSMFYFLTNNSWACQRPQYEKPIHIKSRRNCVEE